MQESKNVNSIWNEVVEDVKLKVIRPTLWRSMEIAVPVIIENGWFVVGFPPGSFHMSGNLTTVDHLVAIERAIEVFSGQKLKLRIIEGDSLEDWTHVKFKDQHVEKLREEARKQQARASETNQSWETLLEQISRRYASAPLRQLPQGKARYLNDILKLMSEAIDELMPAGVEADELTERSLARAIEKVAQYTDIPSPIIALELQRMRGE